MEKPRWVAQASRGLARCHGGPGRSGGQACIEGQQPHRCDGPLIIAAGVNDLPGQCSRLMLSYLALYLAEVYPVLTQLCRWPVDVSHPTRVDVPGVIPPELGQLSLLRVLDR